MESFFKLSFGFKFWRRNKQKQEKINKRLVYRNLILYSDCLASRSKNPNFAGNRDITRDNVVSGY